MNDSPRQPDEKDPTAAPPDAAPSGETMTALEDVAPAADQTPDEELGESLGLELPRVVKPEPGTAPGIEHQDLAFLPSKPQSCFVTCIDYAADRVRVEEVSDLEDFILHHRPEWSQVRWINIDGIQDMAVIQAIAEKYEIHPLALEDILHIPQRPKVDTYGDATQRARMVIITRMVQLVEGKLGTEQITIVLGHKTVITFQETRGDVWDPIRDRIKKTGSRLRQNDASFLAYSLLDAIVDHCFPLLEQYGDRLEELEEGIFNNPSNAVIQQIHGVKRELILLRRQVWPMREMIHVLQREAHECLSDNTRVYLRDVYDHVVQIIDLLETYREVAVGLAETYIASVSHRMNEIMKVLTIISTIFIPITFFAGVWGMNFEGMPETHSEWSYPWAYPIGFWGLCIAIVGGLVWWIKSRHWL